MSTLNITGLCKEFGATRILNDVNLAIASGEFVVFVGPSGCGKSTLLRCISGLESITAGSIQIDGQEMRDVPPAKRNLAMVFQSYALYPQMTVFDNMAYALKLKNLPKADIRGRVERAATRLQLSKYLDRLPRALSGGQRQRVAIGRAIVRDPKIFLFDEPLSNLDAALRVQMRMEIAQLKYQLPNTTMIYVTHDQVEAMTMADRIVVLKDGQIEQAGTPMELYERPRSAFVAGFIGSPRMNFFQGEMAESFDAHSVGVRPEHIAVSEDGEGRPGIVTYAEHLGADTYLYVDAGNEQPVIIRQPGTSPYQHGDKLRFAPVRSKLHRFDPQGVRLQDA